MAVNEKPLEVEVTCTGPSTVEHDPDARGWGAGGSTVTIEGPAAEITVSRNGKSQFTFTIMGDGSVCITQHEVWFSLGVGGEGRLKNERPWK